MMHSIKNVEAIIMISFDYEKSVLFFSWKTDLFSKPISIKSILTGLWLQKYFFFDDHNLLSD